MRILIAEDDFTSRAMLAAVVQKHGHEVVEAADGEEAWAVLKAPDAPVLAILDWMMPGLNGPEVVQRVRGMRAERPPYLILLTSRTEKADVIAGLECGANDYLTKPFDVGELRARVDVGRRMLALQDALMEKVAELQRVLEEVKSLRGILPICASCKKIRDDTGYWQQVEEYVRDHSEAQFSHGICPECMKELYPDFDVSDSDDDEEKNEIPAL
jgi:phosphoserine phosphatase RsbU/P